MPRFSRRFRSNSHRSKKRCRLSAVEPLEARQLLTRLLPGNEFHNGPLAAGEVVFVDFELGSELDASDGDSLTLHTLFSSLTPSNDTELALYDALGNVIAENDDIDFAAGNLLSQLDLTTLPAGDYFAAVGSFDTVFGPGFNATSSSNNTGTWDIDFTLTQNEFGTLASGVVADNDPLVAEEVKFFRFELATDVTAASGDSLVMDTLGSSLTDTGTGPNDTEIGLYDVSGNLLATDDDSNGLLTSQLSFGAGGVDGDLVAGTYFLAAGAFNTTFNAGFDATSVATSTGSIQVNLELTNAAIDPLIVTIATDTVDANDGETSLREAITFANDNSGADTITFDAGLTGETVLVTDGSLPAITGSLTIDGLGQTDLTISDNSTLFELDLSPTEQFSVEDISLQMTGYGAAIRSTSATGVTIARSSVSGDRGTVVSVRGGTLSVTDGSEIVDGYSGVYARDAAVVIIDSSAIRDGRSGGGIRVSGGSLTIQNNSIVHNNTRDGSDGGGVFANNATVIVDNSKISGNAATGGGGDAYGGGIGMSGGSLQVRNGSSITGNNTNGRGGGISAVSGAIVTIDNSSVTGNSSYDNYTPSRYSDGGGIYIDGGTLDILNSSTIGGGPLSSEANRTNGRGGGVFASGAVVTVNNSTVSGNNAENGGGIAVESGSLNVIHGAVVNGNSAAFQGGGIYSEAATATVNGSTISGNSAGMFSRMSAGRNFGGLGYRGGGIFATGGSLDILNGSKIGGDTLAEGNDTTGAGGGVSTLSTAVTVDDSTIRNNLASVGGGMNVSQSPLTLTGGATVADNIATSGDGGGIAFYGDSPSGSASLVINNSTISGNKAQSGGDGGGVNATGGTVQVVNNSQIMNNEAAAGAGIRFDNSLTRSDGSVNPRGADLIISASTISGNTASGRGGGLEVYYASALVNDGSLIDLNVANGLGGGGGVNLSYASIFTLRDSTVSNNRSSGYGGGIGSRGAVTVYSSSISHNTATDGGGIAASGDGEPVVTIVDSTISDNTADGNLSASGSGYGGGIRMSDANSLTMTGSTLSGNHSIGDIVMINGPKGGGIWTIETRVTLNSSTITGNTAVNLGGGIYTGDQSYLTLSNTIVSDNTANTENDLAGSFADMNSPTANFSLISDVTGLTINGSNNILGQSAQLGDLQFNGGPTLTHELQLGSLAINGGDPGAMVGDGTTPDFDQRGTGFDRVIGGRIDIGAFEVQTVTALACDFNGDTVCDGVDINLLQANIVTGPADPAMFDLTNDGNVTLVDRDQWLALAGAENLPSGNAYLLGDANLDGTVDGQDFIAWNGSKFTANSNWTNGDFNSDGTVDGQDFIAWNGNKFQSADQAVGNRTVGRDLVEEDREKSGHEKALDAVFAGFGGR